MLKHNPQPLIMEITILSAQGLKPSSTPFSHRLRPFITLTTVPPTASCKPTTTNVDKKCHVYQTRVDDQGGVNPTWGDKFHVLLDTSFYSSGSIYLQLYTKRLIAGRAHLGWCQIQAHDIELPPAGSVRYLSYRLRARDGSRGQGIVNLAVKVEASVPVPGQNVDMGNTVIGVPVTGFPLVGGRPVTCQGRGQLGVSCQGQRQLGVSCKEVEEGNKLMRVRP